MLLGVRRGSLARLSGQLYRERLSGGFSGSLGFLHYVSEVIFLRIVHGPGVCRDMLRYLQRRLFHRLDIHFRLYSDERQYRYLIEKFRATLPKRTPYRRHPAA